jgi:predicted house-cleaning noncanonical NTP pyrophosphatase (MazG superfamily)
MTFEEFRQLVAEMRRTQKRYFLHRIASDLNQARKLEKQVDEELKELYAKDRTALLPFQ